MKEIVSGRIRIQLLSPSLIRVEREGPRGFEDRKTLLAVERCWPGAKARVSRRKGMLALETERFRVSIPEDASSVRDVRVSDLAGDVLASLARLPGRFDFPPPHKPGRFFLLADTPRVIPPPWGATPPPAARLAGDELQETSGWDFRNPADDIYVFLHDGDYGRLRREFLRLTGPVPMLPLYALGFWDSRYHPYTERSALTVIDRYRRKRIPLDVFVVDTDWRVGGSGGYDIEAKYFPDMPRFLRRCHERNVKVVFNDHPQPNGMKPVEPAMLDFRYRGLTRLQDAGLDIWWYDKNWHDIIEGPIPGLDRELWGQLLYWDAHARHRPGRRPLLMSMRSEHPASHRYPVWWTGDIHSTYANLRQGIADSVRDGIRFLPWVHQDLGGHTGAPSVDLYVRFLQFGCLSPVARVHCTRGQTRYPWVHGAKVEKIVTDFIRLRYRLLPMLYTAARRSYDDGTPVLRRCDFEWPEHKAARSDLQYLLGDDLLVAPMWEGGAATIPVSCLRHGRGAKGLKAEFFDNPDLDGKPVHARKDDTVDYPWLLAFRMPRLPRERFSARWTGSLGPAPEDGEYEIVTVSDDGVRLWLDGRRVIDNWTQHGPTSDTARVRLKKGRSYRLRLEYFQDRGEAVLHLRWVKPSDRGSPVTGRNVWIPPGEWENAWSGEGAAGPGHVRVEAPLREIPLFIRRGAILPLAPSAQHTGEKAWDPVTLELYPPASGTVRRRVYEDDGASRDYERGRGRRTAFRLSASRGGSIAFEISPAAGTYAGASASRAWIVRFHLRPGTKVASVQVNGRATRRYRVLRPPTRHAAGFLPLAGAGSAPAAAAGPVVEVRLARAPVAGKRTIRLHTT